MRECAMQARHGGVAGFMEVTEDMSFRLREIGGMPLDVESNPMGGAVDAENEFEAHQVQDTSKVLDGR